MASNKEIGSNFEKELAEMLSKKGYWVTLLNPRNHIGSQPADLIAVKANIARLIDCKTCNNHLFPISRIEENQWSAYKKYIGCGNDRYYIAIKYNNKVYMIPIETINKNNKSIDLNVQMEWK